jgi:tetratricopeptide (TPR) repeat protein
MGAVYEASLPGDPRRFAAKVVTSPEPTALERFRREGELVARLRHPNVVAVHAAGELPDGRSYLLFELIEGTGLDRLLAERGSLPPKELLRLGAQLASALGAAHALGIVHRDVKPANVLLDERGDLRLADFGVALALDQSRLTQSQQWTGTLAYMAPEQIDPELPVGPWSDVRAAGALLYEAASRHPPFDMGGFALVSRLLHQDPPPLRSVAPDVPHGLATVIDRCLARDHRERYPDGRALGEALQAVAAGEQPAARPARARGRVAGVAAGLVLSCLLLLALALTWQRADGTASPEAEPAQSPQTPSAPEEQAQPESLDGLDEQTAQRAAHEVERGRAVLDQIQRDELQGADLEAALEQAQARAQVAVDMRPGDAPALRLQGEVLHLQGSHEQALAVLDRALAAEEHPDAFHARSRVRYALLDGEGATEDALSCARLILELTERAGESLGLEEAEALARRVLAAVETLARLQRGDLARPLLDDRRLASLLVVGGEQVGEVLQELARVQRLVWLQAPLREGWDRCIDLRGQGLHDEELELANRLVEEFPDHHHGYDVRAHARRATGDLAGALDDFSVALSLVGPSHYAGGLLHARGLLQARLDRTKEALADLDDAIRLHARPYAPLASRAELLAGLGEVEEALADYRRCLEHDVGPAQRPRILVAMSALHEGRGELEDAIELLEDAIEGTPPGAARDSWSEQLTRLRTRLAE